MQKKTERDRLGFCSLTRWVKKLDAASNYAQFIGILTGYPSIAILGDSPAQDILDRVMSKYHINNLHYFWSNADAPIINRTRIQLQNLPAYYEKILPKLLLGNAYLILDCCDDRFIVCKTDLKEVMELLKAYYYELIEIYVVNDAFHICFCMNHVCEAFEFE